MARALAQKLAAKDGLTGDVFDSAGVHASVTEGPTVEAAVFLKSEKINIMEHRSKPLSPQLADSADVIFCMTGDIVRDAIALVGEEFRPKIILFSKGIDLDLKQVDIITPPVFSPSNYRRLYAVMQAAIGRLIRMLGDPGSCPEYFGTKTMEKLNRPGGARPGGKPAAPPTPPVDAEKRAFLANVLFDHIERAFEPPTISVLLRALEAAGQSVPTREVEEILHQDLHSYVRTFPDSTWDVVSGAAQKRRQKARDDFQARVKAANQASAAPPPPPATPKPQREEKITDDVAFEILGLRLGETATEARKKYHALLKRYHPDRFHDDPEFRDMAESKAKRINLAWGQVKERFEDVGSMQADE